MRVVRYYGYSTGVVIWRKGDLNIYIYTRIIQNIIIKIYTTVCTIRLDSWRGQKKKNAPSPPKKKNTVFKALVQSYTCLREKPRASSTSRCERICCDAHHL